MKRPRVTIESSLTNLNRRVADAIEDAAQKAIASRGEFHLCLSGGATPEGAYHELRAPERTGRVDWKSVRFYWGDERPVGPEHPDSNFGMARRALLEWIDVRDGQIHRIRGELGPQPAALDYAKTLIRCFGADACWPVFDLVLLGLDADGHTASLFPNTQALAERHRWVLANDVPSIKTTRITLTYPVINHARGALFMVRGAGKAEAVSRVFQGDKGCPATAISLDGDVAWYMDEDAAAQIR